MKAEGRFCRCAHLESAKNSADVLDLDKKMVLPVGLHRPPGHVAMADTEVITGSRWIASPAISTKAVASTSWNRSVVATARDMLLRSMATKMTQQVWNPGQNNEDSEYETTSGRYEFVSLACSGR
jgi:hypothetical protein